MTITSDELFEAIWRFQYLAVHRHSGSLTGEVLMVLTVMVLDAAGKQPSISELAELTNLPKSSISRYVSNQLKIGHLQEKVDPNDRRRRVLSPTDSGRKEIDWVREQIEGFVVSESAGNDPVSALLEFAKRK